MPRQRTSSERVNPIYRVRTGCLKCRARKKKCDERKPVCRGCERNKLQCQWPPNVVVPTTPVNAPSQEFPDVLLQDSSKDGFDPNSALFHSFHSLPAPPAVGPSASELANLRVTAAISRDGQQNFFWSSSASESSSPSDSSTASQLDQHSSSMLLPESRTQDIPLAFDRSREQQPNQSWQRDSTGDELSTYFNPRFSNEKVTFGFMIHQSPCLLPTYGHDSYELLSHYIGKTASSMNNGFISSNPFLSQFIPLAFSNELILQLLLAQSAAHRAIRYDAQTDKVALSYYGKATKHFRQIIKNHIDGQEASTLVLAVAALIMCFTETAKGDTNGVIFDHLSAAAYLLPEALNADTSIPEDLKNFLVEYYTYALTLSMITVDTTFSAQRLLNPNLERLARQLVESRYVGNLCGCCLELLLMIPQIFELGRQWIVTKRDLDQEGDPATASTSITENMATFATLQAQILRWAPQPNDESDGSIAGCIFQQALLLYLYTSSGNVGNSVGGAYDLLLEETITKSMSLLDKIDPIASINTNLCWPIAIIGSCLRDSTQQQSLKIRLGGMHASIGLGNIGVTLQILEHMWQRPYHETGPWNICRVMQDYELWVSFA